MCYMKMVGGQNVRERRVFYMIKKISMILDIFGDDNFIILKQNKIEREKEKKKNFLSDISVQSIMR